MPIDLNTEEPMVRRFQLSVGPDEYDEGRFLLPPRPLTVGYCGAVVMPPHQRRIHKFRIVEGSLQYRDGRPVGDELLITTADRVFLGGNGSRLAVIDPATGEQLPYGRALLKPLG